VTRCSTGRRGSQVPGQAGLRASLAFEGFTLITNPSVYEYSNIDMTEAAKTRPRRSTTSRSSSSPRRSTPSYDAHAVPRERRARVHGQTTSFRRGLVKDYVTAARDYPGTDEVKYVHGTSAAGPSRSWRPRP